ncbi:DUF6756 family protein [Adhaeribacter pallidiroseus]|uniref:Uncharacterized protein n=1 Tax=Adhaeribacter pallidiroseus TaxID=2072847 RepID=A0A369QC42_9BACT|nr:DUF6756 family protein [Adhaeribacter pallidiroseus]RDC62461.1 hypothetical protein AHMF7616_01055 [Adhaeribacter pallidiroseus]
MTGFKENTIKIASALGLSNDNFAAVGIHDWPLIMQKIERNFVKKENSNTKFNWWWESFKGPHFSIDFINDNAFIFLDQIVDKEEKVWFVACDSDYDPSKFWLFQGYINPIQKIIGELPYIEYYIVSKKYEWLICESDHGVLIGLGSIIPKMQQFKIENNVA